MNIYGNPDAYNPTHYNIHDNDDKLYNCLVNEKLTNFKCTGKIAKANLQLGRTGIGSLVRKPPINLCIKIRNKIKELNK